VFQKFTAILVVTGGGMLADLIQLNKIRTSLDSDAGTAIAPVLQRTTIHLHQNFSLFLGKFAKPLPLCKISRQELVAGSLLQLAGRHPIACTFENSSSIFSISARSPVTQNFTQVYSALSFHFLGLAVGQHPFLSGKQDISRVQHQ
jgi:hypothetical protein